MTSVQRFGDMTGAFVLQLLLPLVIIFLSFAAFAGEREQGTLRQKLSVGASPRILLLGKALGITLPLTVVIGIAAVMGAAVLIAADSAETLPRFIILVATYLLYGLIFLGLSLAVSAIARTAQMALVILIGFWILSSFVVPRFGATIVQYIYPTPSSITFAEAIASDTENGVDGVSQTQRIRELQERTLERYGVNTIAELPVNFEGLSFILMEQLGNAVFDKHYGGLQKTFESQESALQALAVASPLLALQNISAALAGTSLTDAHHFANAAEGFRRQFVRKMNEDLAFNSQSGDTGYRAGPKLWAEVSSFNYQPRPLADIIASVTFSIIVIMAWLIVAVTGAVIAASRLSKAAFE
jgi:ABC-2 type transport system permease protein